MAKLSSFDFLLNIKFLESYWFDLMAKFGINYQQGQVIFFDLFQTYSVEKRYYHNLHHIQHLLALMGEVQEICDRLEVIQFAAWFHDYIYNSQAQDNEVKSAIYAEKTLGILDLAPDLIWSIKQIILSTQKHQPLIDSIDNLIFLDLDLAILGASLDRYSEYARGIRQEYLWMSDRNYQLGRKEILTNFLARERIYYTDYFYQKFELAARANLATEIKSYTLDK